MSHYAVLVVGEDIDGQMAPYHEFECTGEDDQYVQDIDVTEKARLEYEKDTETRVKSPSGKLTTMFTKKGNYKKRFLRDPTPEEIKENGQMIGGGGNGKISWTSTDLGDGKGYRTQIIEMPKGWERVEVPSSETVPFAEWIEGYYGHKVVPHGKKPDLKGTHKFGYTLVTKMGEVIKTINRTNPNHKWDGYCVGGRARGFFKLKAEAVAAGAGTLGRIPLMAQYDPTYEAVGVDRADQALKGEIDIEGMRQEAGDAAAKLYDRFHRILAKNPGYQIFDELLAKHGIPKYDDDAPELTDEEEEAREKAVDAVRKEYNAQPGARALQADKDFKWMWHGFSEFNVSRDEYILTARDRAFTTFAVVKDGKWYEKGHMGWFAIVSDAKEQDDWNKEFNAIVDSLPDDTLLTVVDCHT